MYAVFPLHFSPKCFTKSDLSKQRLSAKITGFLSQKPPERTPFFAIYLCARIYYSEAGIYFSPPPPWTSSSSSSSSSSNVRKKDININTYESSETFRRVDRISADFNSLGDFSHRDNAHGDRVFSDRDKREHRRYACVLESVCFF